MSLEGDNQTHESSIESILSLILDELRLLNARIEEEFQTDITEVTE